MEKFTPQALDKIREAKQQAPMNWIKVGMSTCGIAAGADKVFQILKEEIKKHDLTVKVEQCGCAGMCYAEPLVEVCIEGMPQVTYGTVDEETALRIVNKHVLGKFLLNDHIFNVKVK